MQVAANSKKGKGREGKGREGKGRESSLNCDLTADRGNTSVRVLSAF